MKNSIRLVLLAVTSITMSACSTLGKDEFTCKSLKKDGVCAGPRDVYELTNNRETLENLSLEDLDRQVNKEKYLSGTHDGHSHESAEINKEVVVYEPRTMEQQSPDSYQAAKVLPQTRFDTGQRSSFDAWPNNGEPMAPEAMAMMAEPMPMRIMIASYKDSSGFLNMPGYIFVDVQPRTWQIGEQANIRRSRVVPLQIQRTSQNEMERQEQRRSGVDGLGVETSSSESK